MVYVSGRKWTIVRHLRFPSLMQAAGSIFLAAVLVATLQGVALAVPTSQYPVLLNGFPGVSDPGDVAPPNASGAVGLAHLVAVTSAGVAVFDKGTGNLLTQVPLQEFWAPLGTGPGEPAAQPVFGPRIVYDKSTDRFIAVSVAGKQAPDSWLLIAATATPDPTGPWYRWAINASQNNDPPTFPPHDPPPPTLWADYPSVGYTNDDLTITVNMYSNDNVLQYPKFYYSIPKSQLVSGTTPITWVEGRATIDSLGYGYNHIYFGSAYPPRFTVQPTQFSGGVDRIAFAAEKGGACFGFCSSAVIAGAGYIYVDYYPPDALPPAPQAGNTPPIDTNDQRLQSVVDRDGYLWIAHNVADNTNRRTEIAWYQVDPNQADIPSADSAWGFGHHPIQQGRISDPVRSYYNPSIAVNANHDVVIGFSGSSPTEYPSAFYAARVGVDDPGTMRPVQPLKTGIAPYTRLIDGTRNAWGIYSATTVDPADDLTFWTFQEYAAADNTWGTWWGTVSIADPPTVSGVTVTATPPGPVEPGPQVVFEAAATGGSGNYEYQFWGKKSTQTSYSLARNYSPGNTWAWNTADAGAGTYSIQVYARNLGSTLASEAMSAPLTYVISIPGGGIPVAEARLAALSFTGKASGGSGNYEYEIRGRLQGSAEWGLAQAYGPNPTWIWPTVDVPPGTYEIKMNSRNAGSADPYQAAETVSCTVNSPLSSGSIIPPLSAEPPAGNDPAPVTGIHLSSLTFTGQAAGGSGNYEYEYLWRFQGGNWGVARAFDADPSWTWQTYEVPPATYEFRINARNVGSDAAFEATDNVSCTLAIPHPASVTIAPGPASPETVGMKVNFTAAASPANGLYEYEFQGRLAGGAWGVARSFDQYPSWEWDSAGAAPGNYEVKVNARSAGSTAAVEATQTVPYVIHSPATGVTLAPSLPSPQFPNATIQFIATATGGSGTYEYEFQERSVGGSWTIVKNYSLLTTTGVSSPPGPPYGSVWTWVNPPPGSYEIKVNVRNTGSTGAAEATQTISYVILENTAIPVAGVTLTPSLPSPQPSNTTIKFLASATGGTGTYEFEFQGRPVGGSWTVVKGYGELTEGPPLGAGWTWISPPPGSYEIMVNARDAGSTAPYEATATIPYEIR